VGSQGEKPNIILILADDWGFGDLGCHGHGELQTPNLDRLAKQGTRFMQFRVTSPVCSPSRCSIMTGQYPARHRIHGHFARYDLNEQRNMPHWLDVGVHTLPRLLQSGGYKTAHFGKWHLGGGGGMHGHPDAPEPVLYGYDETRVWNGNGPGWNGTTPWPFPIPNDTDEPFLPHSDLLAVEGAMTFIERQAATNHPFFINLWLRTPHTPLRATAEQRKPYLHIDEPKQTYYAVITEADRQIGRLIEFIEAKGITENTLILFTSDNGPETPNKRAPETQFCQGSTAGLRGRKRSLYDGGVRVPFLVKWPGVVPANRVDYQSLLSSVDLFPTLSRIAGVHIPTELHLDGVDTFDALEGKPFDRQIPLMWEWRFANPAPDSRECPMHAIRWGNYVLLQNPDGNRVELFNTSIDYWQQENIAASNPDMVKRLQVQLQEWSTTLPGK
jgi:N-acetylgalactosamine-6-sulfatase